MIESVLAALKTGRNIYCDEKNINPLKIHYGDIVILLATRELFRKQKKIDLSFTEFEIHLKKYLHKGNLIPMSKS